MCRLLCFFFIHLSSIPPDRFQNHLSLSLYLSLHFAAVRWISFLAIISRLLDSLHAIIFPASHTNTHTCDTIAHIFTPLSCPLSILLAAALQRRVRSLRYPLTCCRFFTREHLFNSPFASYTPAQAHAILTARRTLKSHKALRRIFHAVISAECDERRYPSRPRPDHGSGK